jgi:hypothetical protein
MGERIFQAIETRWHGPTNTRPSRIVARCDARRVTVSWDHSLDVVGNHRAAAEKLAAALDWQNNGTRMVGGGLGGNGYVWVFAEMGG